MRDHARFSRHLLASGAALVLASCGGADVEATGAGKPRTTVEPAPVVVRAPVESPVRAEAEEAPAVATEAPSDAPGPVLSVYVGGPAATTEAPRSVGPVAYATDVVVINTGGQPADVSEASVEYEAWRDEERVPCATTERGLRGGPETLQPSQAFTYRSEATCELDEPGVYELRAYVSFGAQAPDFQRASHHVARLVVELPPSP